MRSGPLGAGSRAHRRAAGWLLCLALATPLAAGTGPATLEDIYGDSGELFQAGISIINLEGDGTEALAGAGLTVDDPVLRWREFTLVPDATDCSTSGSCAVVDVQSRTLYEGNAVLSITVLESTPDAANDCDFDGTPDGTTDCDGNGTPDVVVKVTSEAEVAGEIVVCNATGNPGEYKGSLPMSTFGDSAGVLFLAASGTDDPTATVLYLDNDDGTGNACKNNVDPSLWGRVTTAADVIIPTASVEVIGTQLTDNGDNDGFADTNETVDMRIRVLNNGGTDLQNVIARLSTNDPKIDCVIHSTIAIGTLPAHSDLTTTGAFTFRVAGSPIADRAANGLNDLDSFPATFSVVLAGDGFDGPAAPQMVSIQLDLDPSGGSGPTSYFEGFETGLGTFEVDNIDATHHGSIGASDGFRCQYHDPEWIQSNSYGLADCYLGATPTQAAAVFWQVHTTGAVDNGKAYSGQNSLYMGIFGGTATEFTTPMAVLEAAETTNPVNLGWNGVSPDLTFKQQVSFIDGRALNMPFENNADRGVVHVQLADAGGNPVGDWIKITAFANGYDTQNYDNYGGICMFDPIDDGSTEDDFFDPTDPLRRLGPSSTCFPEFTYSCIGNTFSAYSETNTCNAFGPGLQGSLGVGTWIESKFSLNDFRGRRIRLRFLNTALKLSTFPDWETLFGTGPTRLDDGWWIDDVSITDTLTTPAVFAIDTKANTLLPPCGSICTSVTADLTATPSSALPAPGQVVELDASGSMADRCLDGTLQYQFWLDGNGNGAGGDPADTLLRAWSDNPVWLDAPGASRTYVVDVRCSSLPPCNDSASLPVTVTIPGSGPSPPFQPVGAPNKTTFTWPVSQDVDYVRGRLERVPSYDVQATGTLTGTTSLDTSGDLPAPGKGFYYLFKATQAPEGSGYPTWASAGTDHFDRDDVMPDFGCNRPATEAWTVNAGDDTFSVIDSCTEQVVHTGDLATGGGGFHPRSIAFSTLAASPGGHAFVSQGPLLRVLDAATRTVIGTLDLESLAVSEFPGTCSMGGNLCTGAGDCAGGGDTCESPVSIRLAGLASARRQTFSVGPRAFLYAAANVEVTVGTVEPWYVVLDQDALVPPTSSPAVVAAGRLFLSPPSVLPEALDVTVVSYPALPALQRAWFTTRVVDTTDSVQAVLVATPATPGWSVQRVVDRPLGAAGPAPDGLTIGAGRTGSLAFLPEGPTGKLIDVAADPATELCSLGGVQRAVDMTGPAGGSYRAYALDETGFLRTFLETDIAAPTCDGTSVAVGTGPTAVDAFGQDFALRAFVANGGSDSVTMLRTIEGTPTTSTIALSGGTAPADVAARTREETSCSIGPVAVAAGTVSWNSTNCPASGITFFVWCRCFEANPADCPVTCPAPAARCPGCREAGAEPWEPMGVVQGSASFDSDSGTASVEYEVTTNQREPTKE